jgi:hypothetical protein
MIQLKQREQQPNAERPIHEPRVVIPGHEFTDPLDFARFLRESEVVWLHGVGMRIAD